MLSPVNFVSEDTATAALFGDLSQTQLEEVTVLCIMALVVVP